MPHITTAMKWSRRRSIMDIVVESLLSKRDLVSQATDVKTTFSSWDNCMKQSYCKWPAIAIIVVVGLILLSIVTCIVRCCCCGMSCCCTCFSCLNCCCGSACDGKKNKPMKNLDEPYNKSNPFAAAPPPGQGYQAPAPMMGGALAAPPSAPQFAQFEVGKNGLYVESKPPAVVSEDALPPMPSWDGAAKKHIPTAEEKAIELGDLDPATGQKMPLMAGAAATGISAPPSPGGEFPQSPYGARPGQGGNKGYMNVPADQYGQQNRGGFNASPAPGMGGYGQQNAGMGGQGRYGSPAPTMGGFQGGPNRYNSPAPQGQGFGPGRGGPDRYGSPGPQGMNRPARGYGPASPQDPYSPQDSYAPNDGFNAAGGYGRPPPNQYPNDPYANNGQQFPPPNRQYTNESSRPGGSGRQYSNRSEVPSGPGYPVDNYEPQVAPRGPSRGPGGPQRLASPPLNNNSGFDFGGGYQSSTTQHYNEPVELESIPSPSLQQQGFEGQSQRPNQGQGERRRPPPQQESGYGGFGEAVTSAAPSYASRSPPADPNYPGYKSYPAPQQGSSRGQREPQGWDPVRQ